GWLAQPQRTFVHTPSERTGTHELPAQPPVLGAHRLRHGRIVTGQRPNWRPVSAHSTNTAMRSARSRSASDARSQAAQHSGGITSQPHGANKSVADTGHPLG